MVDVLRVSYSRNSNHTMNIKHLHTFTLALAQCIHVSVFEAQMAALNALLLKIFTSLLWIHMRAQCIYIPCWQNTNAAFCFVVLVYLLQYVGIGPCFRDSWFVILSQMNAFNDTTTSCIEWFQFNYLKIIKSYSTDNLFGKKLFISFFFIYL